MGGPQSCDSNGICTMGTDVYSPNPIRYANGAVMLPQTDVAAPAGSLFGYTRYFSNQTYGSYLGVNGYNWFAKSMPYLTTYNNSVAVAFDPSSPYWFDLSGGTYVPRYGVKDVSLTHNSTAQTFTFVQTAGGQQVTTVFNDFTTSTAPGGFLSQTDARGVTISVTGRSGNSITTLERSYTLGGVTTNETLTFTYFTSGTWSGQLQMITYARQVGGGSWTNISQVTYAYYGSSDSNGNLDDLQSATQQIPDGSGGWNTVGITYYRYYLSGATHGYQHGLKMHFGPEAYRQMLNAGINPLTASDSTIQSYADHYFEYDPTSRSVTKEISAVCDTCPGGGNTTDVFTYTQSGNANGFNNWATKTAQALPDNSQKIVYSNYAGMPMLSVTIDPSGSNKWCTFYRYDSNGNLIWKAHPSAVNGYNDSYADLLNYNGSTYQYLNNSTGLIEVIDYFSSTNLSLGQVQNYVSDTNVRQGQSGSNVMVRSYTYTSNTDSNGNTIYLPATITQYPVAGNTSTTIVTSYSYSFYSGTNTVSQRTTTLPAVSSGQNGSGSAYTIVEQYDSFGHLTQTTDERGIVNQYTYGGLLGLMTQQVLNYQSGVNQPGVNVTTTFTYDSFGRLIQTMGPSHTVDLSGTATSVQPVTWTVYIQSAQPTSGTWAGNQVWQGKGYATGTSPNYTYALVNPVTLTFKTKKGRVTDLITSRRTTGSGALSSSNTFAQSDYQTWVSTQYNSQGETTSMRTYFLIPSSGTGTAGTNYAETDFGYDALERRNRVVSSGGTITRTVWTTPQNVASVWLGTNDTGATDSNPAGSGSPNNMVMVTANQWDGGNAGGDGNLTQVTQYASATDTRVTSYAYDFRDRQTSATDALNRYTVNTYDNFDRVTQVQRYTSSSGTLIGQNQTNYDNRGRVYQQVTYAVNPNTGVVGNALTTNNWFDPSGNLLQSIKGGGGQVFSKFTYNGVNWMTASYRGYNTSGTSYSQATTVANDTILSQTVPTFDEVGNTVSQAVYDRLNDATGTGALSYGTQPKARVSYAAAWFDGVDRAIASANYGALSSFTRPSTPPASSSTVLVTSTSYDDAGRVYQVTDPLGLVNQTTYDNANRTTQTVEAYGTSNARTTNWAYTLDNLVASLTAVNSTTGNQTTTYTYGSTLTESGVARNDLLRYIDYPDSSGGSDRMAYTYNRQSQPMTVTDQRGTVRTFYYDKLGRRTDDAVSTVGGGTDNAVLRISTTYEVRGMIATLTSYNNATPGSGTALNQVQFTYNTFSQLIEEQQEHSGTVSGSSLNVQYGYDTGASNSNEIRPSSITYPNGRVINYIYGSGMDSTLNRVTNIQDNSTSVNLATYIYLGLGTVIRIDYSQPQVRLDLWGGTSGTFNGLDLFNRIIDQRWLNYNTSTDLDRYQYGYDQDANRIWKANTVTTGLDEFYTYDSLNRLGMMQRGTLNSGKTGISGTPAREMDYTLDPTGNWPAYVTKTSGTTDLNQSRTANKVNEITAISGTPTWATPAYDAAGNMTTLPQVSTPTSSYTAVYDAWNRMVKLSASGSTVATYAYDGNNRRITKVTTATSETRQFYFTFKWQDIEERTGSPATMERQYVWGIRYIDELVCRDRTSERYYAMQDANFNLTGICDTSAAVQERYLYDPYGNVTYMNASWSVISSSAYAWQVNRQGLLQDVESRLLYNRNRMLHSQLGVFGRRDPLRYLSGSNLYEYQKTNPLVKFDPSGNGISIFPVEATVCCRVFTQSTWCMAWTGIFQFWGSKKVFGLTTATYCADVSIFSEMDTTIVDRMINNAGSSCCQPNSGPNSKAEYVACVQGQLLDDLYFGGGMGGDPGATLLVF